MRTVVLLAWSVALALAGCGKMGPPRRRGRRTRSPGRHRISDTESPPCSRHGRAARQHALPSVHGNAHADHHAHTLTTEAAMKPVEDLTEAEAADELARLAAEIARHDRAYHTATPPSSPMPITTPCAAATRTSRRGFPHLIRAKAPAPVSAARLRRVCQSATPAAHAVPGQRLRARGFRRVHRPRAPLPGPAPIAPCRSSASRKSTACRYRSPTNTVASCAAPPAATAPKART